MKPAHFEFFPPPEHQGRFGVSLSVAAAAHVLLVFALAWGIDWNSQAPDALQAELWANIPQMAAPLTAAPTEPNRSTQLPPPEPSLKEPSRPLKPRIPQPSAQELREAQLAIEKIRREIDARIEKKRQEAEQEKIKARERERERAKEAEKKKITDRQEKDQLATIEAIRKKNLQQLRDQIGSGSGDENNAGTGARNMGGISGQYAGKVRAAVLPNIIKIQNIAGNPSTEVRVTFAPDGRVISQVITKASGVSEWDDAVLRAIERTRIFPRQENGTMPNHLILSFSPKDL